MPSIETVDLAVVGAGIIGATAAWLATQRRPDWRVLLLDRSLAGQGATLYSLGLHFPYGRTETQKLLSTRSVSLYSDMAGVLPAPPLQYLTFVGVVHESRADQVIGRFTAASVRCADAEERHEILEAHPGLCIRREQVVLTGCMAARGVPAAVTADLVRLLRNTRYGQCWEGANVESVQRTSGGYCMELFDGRSITARRVLTAPGPWVFQAPGAALARAAGVRIKKVAAMHVDVQPPSQASIIYFFDEDAFLLPVPKRGGWLLSFTSTEWDCEPGLNLGIRTAERAMVLDILDRYWPALRNHCGGGRAFCDAYSRDWAPLVTADPEAPGLVFAGACSGAGFRLAPAVAEQALELLLLCETEQQTHANAFC